MSKKSFKDTAGASIDKFFSVNDTQKKQEVPQVQEVQVLQEAQATQGRTGVKMQRINMAFTPSNIDFIRVMAKLKGQTMTQFVNDLISQEREANPETYLKAKEFVESF